MTEPRNGPGIDELAAAEDVMDSMLDGLRRGLPTSASDEQTVIALVERAAVLLSTRDAGLWWRYLWHWIEALEAEEAR